MLRNSIRMFFIVSDNVSWFYFSFTLYITKTKESAALYSSKQLSFVFALTVNYCRAKKETYYKYTGCSLSAALSCCFY